MENLAVIMPVYNEEEIVSTVVENWTRELETLKIDYTFFVYNNDSKDSSRQIIEDLAKKNPRIILTNKKNEGHGPAVLKGYKDNSPNYTWIFQLDSDNEMGPESFSLLWEKRNDYDFLIAKRVNRVQNLSRKLVSLFSRLSINFLFGKSVYDVNCPYRLMRAESFAPLFKALPANTVSPNLIICGFASIKNLRFFEQPVSCSLRKTGKVSMQKWTLIKASVVSFLQSISFALDIRIKK